LKFAKDRHRWLQWLYQARKRYRLTILNYTVTSNHIHLIVYDDLSRQQIPRSIQLVAGYSDFESFQKAHRQWVSAALTKAEPRRKTQWTEAIAVGDESFIRFVKSRCTL
jgi:REP element-mobilizing transposase RayT